MIDILTLSWQVTYRFQMPAARLTRKCIDLAMEGDPTALRLCLSRILPVKRERHHLT